MKFNNLTKYKHDITGKLASIERIISPLNEDSFENNNSTVLLTMIHETLITTFRTSKETLNNRKDHKFILRIVESANVEGLEKSKIGKVEYYTNETDGQTSFLFKALSHHNENLIALTLLSSYLPINEILNEANIELDLAAFRELL
jgi:hypothetical protein